MANRIACTGLERRIMMGRVNKAGTAFTGMTTDVTSDVLKSVIEFIGPGNTKPVTVDGKPMYQIEVRLIESGK
jgi:hypothetical protein